MTAEILAVGTELLMGQIANTNAQYISSKLPDIGINVYFHQVVGDNPARLKSALRHALDRSDVVIMTGGLGPTMDDLTKEAVAECFGRKLAFDEESLSRIRERMSRYGGVMAKNNERQAFFPEGAYILYNDNGTAPGCVVEEAGKTIIMLPGPPSEMRPMFDEKVMPYLGKHADYRLESKFLRIFGIGESRLEEMLKELIEAQRNPTIATYAKEGEVTIRLTARYGVSDDPNRYGDPGDPNRYSVPGDPNRYGDQGAVREDLLAPLVGAIRDRVGDCLFSVDDEDLETAALRALTERGLTLSLAESCTGGLIAARITAIPGASKAFLSSAVTYGNAAKMKILGVKEETLRAYGAVSAQTALEMAEGARRVFGSDIAVSVTGVAGPDGGGELKPVGLVYLALSGKDGARSKEIHVAGPRARVRNITCLNAFDMIRRAALGLAWVD